MAALHQRVISLEDHAQDMVQWKRAIEESTRTQREMIRVGEDIASALRVLGWIGAAIKWIAGVGAAATAIYLSVKGVMGVGDVHTR